MPLEDIMKRARALLNGVVRSDTGEQVTVIGPRGRKLPEGLPPCIVYRAWNDDVVLGELGARCAVLVATRSLSGSEADTVLSRLKHLSAVLVKDLPLDGIKVMLVSVFLEPAPAGEQSAVAEPQPAAPVTPAAVPATAEEPPPVAEPVVQSAPTPSESVDSSPEAPEEGDAGDDDGTERVVDVAAFEDATPDADGDVDDADLEQMMGAPRIAGMPVSEPVTPSATPVAARRRKRPARRDAAALAKTSDPAVSAPPVPESQNGHTNGNGHPPPRPKATNPLEFLDLLAQRREFTGVESNDLEVLSRAADTDGLPQKFLRDPDLARNRIRDAMKRAGVLNT